MKRGIYLIAFFSVIICSSKICHGQIKDDSVSHLKKIGIEILNGLEISKIDERYIYSLIHSIMTKDSIDRAFYFKVFNKIKKQADGYIAEDISFYAKDFSRSYPNDFFCLTSSELKSFAIEIGEIIRTEEEFPQKYADDYVKEIKSKSLPQYLQKVETFSKDLFDAMESRK